MEDFKKAITINSISISLITGRPLSKMWKMPEHAKENASLLTKLFGTIGHSLYAVLTKEQQEEAIKWFETSGDEISKMYDSPLYEDLGESDSTFDLNLLKEKYSDIYDAVVRDVVNKVYKKQPDDKKDIIIETFIESPEVFIREIVLNT